MEIAKGGTWLARLVVGLPLLAVGCVSSYWREIVSEHFVLTTDLGSERGRSALKEMETYRSALLAAAWPHARRSPSGQIPVVLVSKSEWRIHTARLDGRFLHSFLFQPMVVMVDDKPFYDQNLVRHELFHYLADFYFPRQPSWLAEGLAEFFMTVQYDEPKQLVTCGFPPSYELTLARYRDLVPAEDLVNDRAKIDDPEFYPSSWLLVFYLLNKEPERFARYQRELVRSKAPYPELWKSIFGDIDLQKVDATLHDYAKNGNFVDVSRYMRPPAVTFRERPLVEADLYAARAVLGAATQFGTAQERAASARASLDDALEAVRQDPTNVLALAVMQFALGLDVPLDRAMAAAGKHPDDWRAWMLIAQAHRLTGDAPAAERALSRAAQLAQGNPTITASFTPTQRRKAHGD